MPLRQTNTILSTHFCPIWTKMGVSTKIINAVQTMAVGLDLTRVTIPYLTNFKIQKVTSAKLVLSTAPTVSIDTIE